MGAWQVAGDDAVDARATLWICLGCVCAVGRPSADPGASSSVHRRGSDDHADQAGPDVRAHDRADLAGVHPA